MAENPLASKLTDAIAKVIGDYIWPVSTTFL
jgi:hypothetical protein